MEGQVERIKNILERIRRDMHVADIKIQEFKTKEYEKHLIGLRIQLEDAIEISYEVSALLSTLTYMKSKMNKICTDGHFRMGPSIRNSISEINDSVSVYRAISYSFVERSHALRLLIQTQMGGEVGR